MTPSKFNNILARFHRGSTQYERETAQRIAGLAIARHGIEACLPGHPLARASSAEDILRVAEGMWSFDFVGGRRACSDQVWAGFFLGLPVFGRDVVQQVLNTIQLRMTSGWSNGRWTGGNDLHFLGVVEWGVEQALLRSV